MRDSIERFRTEQSSARVIRKLVATLFLATPCLVLMGFGCGAASTEAMALVICGLVLAVTVLLLVPNRPDVLVGADGVRYRHHGEWVFLSYRHTRGISVDSGAVTLQTDTGRAAAPRFRIKPATSLGAALQRRLAEFKNRQAMALPPDLARKGEALHDWRRRVLAKVEGGGYRDATLAPLLVRIVENPMNEPEERGILATVLATLGNEHRPVLVRVAEETVDPTLRSVFEQAVAGEADDKTLARLRSRSRE
ncbi:MAG: hypothetical protein AAGF12_16275 [Myxococcota bacterium]